MDVLVWGGECHVHAGINGEQLAANRVRGCRAVLAYNVEIARLGREHNNANVVSLGARFTPNEEGWQIVQAFLEQPFTEEARHARRVDKMSAYEDAHRA